MHQTLIEALWWALYTVVGIWLQTLLPGIDCLAPGLIVCLQARRLTIAFWLAVLWILIQEGSGSLAFGASILWYAGLVIFFYGLSLFLTVKSAFFGLFLSLFAGLWHFSIIFLLANLQELSINFNELLVQSLQTIIVFPVLWGIVSLIYHLRIAPGHVTA